MEVGQSPDPPGEHPPTSEFLHSHTSMADKEELHQLLLDGARYGDDEDVSSALQGGADIDATGYGGSTGESRERHGWRMGARLEAGCCLKPVHTVQSSTIVFDFISSSLYAAPSQHSTWRPPMGTPRSSSSCSKPAQ